MRNDLRSRWWPVPGILAILGSLVIVAATQGWLRATPVPLPRAVQAGVEAHATVTATGSTPPVAVTVVTPSHPVIVDLPAEAAGTSGPADAPGTADAVTPSAIPSTTSRSSSPPTEDAGAQPEPILEPRDPGAASPSAATTTVPNATTQTSDSREADG